MLYFCSLSIACSKPFILSIPTSQLFRASLDSEFLPNFLNTSTSIPSPNKYKKPFGKSGVLEDDANSSGLLIQNMRNPFVTAAVGIGYIHMFLSKNPYFGNEVL